MFANILLVPFKVQLCSFLYFLRLPGKFSAHIEIKFTSKGIKKVSVFFAISPHFIVASRLTQVKWRLIK